ncbi:Oidioi.mRNA.OKI2018_I69.XSR.g15307.t1.cds [Oikopleura dioica]|uniref:Oidioi.mRNA.OKI2018_I69.XSR.g15307.t1.cds n=1 Tax=Oikopleura dioica TaxID=34765 RepID=A0ABN7SHJ1_OIKDI|nr:Oidioi.mRNA.OKI2018_I69.XSR.g15307.t1.cds [Oikopleura dioica]
MPTRYPEEDLTVALGVIRTRRPEVHKTAAGTGRQLILSFVDENRGGRFNEEGAEPKFAEFARQAAPLLRHGIFGKLRTCIHECAWKAKDLRSNRKKNQQRLMLASSGFSDELAADLVALMWQNSVDILDREDDDEVNLNQFKSLRLYSKIIFVPELVMLGFHENILSSLDESSEHLMNKEILNLSPTEESLAFLEFDLPTGNTSSTRLDSSFEFVNLLDYEVFQDVSVEFGGNFHISLGIEPSYASHLATRQVVPTRQMVDEKIRPCSSCEANVAIKVKNLSIPIFVLMHFGDGVIQQIDGVWTGTGVSDPKVEMQFTDLWFC